MKIRYWLGIILIIVLAVHLSASGLIGFQGGHTMQNEAISKVLPAVGIQNALQNEEELVQDKSIFSRTTIISLIVAVMGIVAFRRNNFS